MYRIETLTVNDSPMEVFVFEPEGKGPFPGMVVAQHIPIGHTGLENDTFTLDVGERMAANGYVTAIPFIFHWWPKTEEMAVKRAGFRDDWTIADLNAAFDLLAAREDVDATRIGLLGHCWGGRVAWVGAATNPRYRAMTMLYGGRVRLPMGGIPAIELVDRIKCPVLGIFGNEDQSPSPEDVDVMEAALAGAGVPHTFLRYDGAGHGFQDYKNPDRYREGPAKDAWGKLLAFFEKELK
jgi:carboxymethylenebutenolidase